MLLISIRYFVDSLILGLLTKNHIFACPSQCHWHQMLHRAILLKYKHDKMVHNVFSTFLLKGEGSVSV